MPASAPLAAPLSTRAANGVAVVTTRTVASVYLPTVGLLSVVQAVRFYIRNPKG